MKKSGREGPFGKKYTWLVKQMEFVWVSSVADFGNLNIQYQS